MELLDIGVKPISEAKPSGEDSKYEPEYDELQQEIDKLSSATAGGAIDWKQVGKLSSTILLKKSKDMKVASYLGASLIHLKGVEGISVGAEILLDLVNNFWDTMYPPKKRIRGRFNAVKWWGDAAEKFLKEYDGAELEPEAVAKLTERVDGLDSALAEKSDDAPILRSISDAAGRLPVKEVPPPVEVPPNEMPSGGDMDIPQIVDSAAPAPAQNVPPSSASSPVPAGSAGNDAEYSNLVSSGLSALSSASDYLLTNNPSDPSCYRFRRMSAWLPVLAVPPADKGKTMIPAPDSLVRDSILNQIKSGDYAGAVQASESRISQFLFWLDLSRFSFEALGGLGPEYQDARDQLAAETALYVKRFPGIESLSFSDGTPFADPKTKKWLGSITGQSGEESGASVGADSEAAKVVAQAEELSKANKIFDAVSVIQEGLNRSLSCRDSFLMRVGMINLLNEAEHNGLACVHAKELLAEIDKFNLEQWEPELALVGFKAVYDAVSTADGDSSIAELSIAVLQRIGRLNPAEALKINGL